MNNDRKVAIGAAAFALAAMTGVSFADDVVGVMSVDVGTNGLAEVEMPFSPLCPDHGPIGYVAGAFLGDGSELSDRLVRFDADSATSTNAVWDGDRWLDPATGIPSLMTAKPGDTLFLLRYDGTTPIRSDFTPSDAPRLTSRRSRPRISRPSSSIPRTRPSRLASPLRPCPTTFFPPTLRMPWLPAPAGCTSAVVQAIASGLTTRHRPDLSAAISSPTRRAIRTAMVSPTHWKSTSTAHRRFLRIRTATVSRTDSKSPGVRIRLSQTKAYRMLGRKGSSFRTSVQA